MNRKGFGESKEGEKRIVSYAGKKRGPDFFKKKQGKKNNLLGEKLNQSDLITTTPLQRGGGTIKTALGGSEPSGSKTPERLQARSPRRVELLPTLPGQCAAGHSINYYDALTPARRKGAQEIKALLRCRGGSYSWKGG